MSLYDLPDLGLAREPAESGGIIGWGLDNLAEITPPRYVLDGILLENEAHILSAPGGYGKSAAAQSMSLAIASGTAWGGKRVSRRPVLYFTGEGMHSFDLRVKAWRYVHGHWGKAWMSVHPLPNLIHPGHDFEIYCDFLIPQWGECLAVIDTVARSSRGGNENQQHDMSKITAAADRLCEAGATVLMLHHANAEGRARGSTLLRDDLCGVYHLTKERWLTRDKLRDDEGESKLALELRKIRLPDDLLPPDAEVKTAPVVETKTWWTRYDLKERCRPLVYGGLGSNAVWKEVGGDRNTVLSVVRELKQEIAASPSSEAA